MKRVVSISMMLLVSTLLWACSDQGKDEKNPDGAIPQHQLDAMEKAKSVEDKLKQADNERHVRADEEKEPE